MSKQIPVFEDWPFKVPNTEKIIKSIGELTAEFQNAPSAQEALKVWKKSNKLMEKVETEISVVQVRFTIDTRVPKYVKAMEKLNNDIPLLSAAQLQWVYAILNSKYRPELEEKLGKFYFQQLEYSVKCFDEKIIEEAQKENELVMRYDALIASAQIEFRGGTYNLTQMGKFMQDLDRETRKEASEAYYAYLETKKDEIEQIYDELVHIRDAMAKKLGYKNYVELAYVKMTRYDYNQEDVKGYRDEIAECVTPLAGKLAKEQFKRCNIKKPEIYDLNVVFPDGNPIPLGTTEEKVQSAIKMYDQLSPETSKYFRFMVDHHVLDLDSKPGKQSGGYMTHFPKYGTAFIFSNFIGTSGDVDVLTHEFGHSFQYFMSEGIKIPEQRMPTMEACEIDSMSMEFFAEPYMDLFFEEPDKYRFEHLASSISFLPYGVTVDEFQEWVYENPDATPAERDQKWHELELKYTPYKVAVYKDCKYMAQGHRWLTQGHIFASPFYYIDYTLAQVMAFQFFNLDRKNHALAWNRYLKLCKMGGKYPFRTLVVKAGMKDPFVKGTIKKTISPLVKQLKTYSID